MKVIIAGGGTGGHLFPAVAVGEELQRQDLRIELLFVGASNGLEARWLPQHGYHYRLLEVRGLTGKDPLTRVRALADFAAATSRARALIHEFAPQLIIGAGGYASAPVAVAGILARLPLVLLEQNVRPGFSNRMLWRFARRVCVGFDEAAGSFSSARTVVTGNPVRFEPKAIGPPPGQGKIQILVLGGSSGAHRLNLGVLNALTICRKSVINFTITHQTGEADVKLVADGYRELTLDARVLPFIDDMAGAFRAADLIIARSGAMTVSEVALAARPAIFVPYPFHRDRQQELNARVLERRGAARIVFDDNDLGRNLAGQIDELTIDRAQLLTMGAKAAAAAKPDAAKAIARICIEEAGKLGA
jgi:UDP-N-acetylglucosamine--N-acetylmuramyl-(pentapeptide) pyrophosphoryl-undecaprenol N-acetylglucosamine transferase